MARRLENFATRSRLKRACKRIECVTRGDQPQVSPPPKPRPVSTSSTSLDVLRPLPPCYGDSLHGRRSHSCVATSLRESSSKFLLPPSPDQNLIADAPLLPVLTTLLSSRADLPRAANMTQSSQSKSTSVFQALGSYADRIKDQPNGVSKASSSSSTPAPAVANSSKKANNRTGSARPASPAPAQSRADADAEDGPWETVRTGRNKTKPERQQPQDEKRASNSRNWRERDDKAADSKDKAGDAERPQKDEPAPKKDEVATTSSKGAQAATRPAVTPPKSAWAATGGKGVAAAVAAAAPAPPAPVEGPTKVATTSTKPVANGTAAPGNAPTAAASSATPVVEPSTSAPAPSKADEEGNWRARPKTETTAAPIPTPTPAPSVPKQAAPPPATNAWDLRRKVQPSAPTAAAPASSNVSSAATPLPQPSQVGTAPSSSAAPSTSAPEPNGDAKAGSSKKAKKKGEAAAAADASLWPDVTQAAEAVKVADSNKGKHEKKGSEVSGSGADEASSSAVPGGSEYLGTRPRANQLQRSKSGRRSLRPNFRKLPTRWPKTIARPRPRRKRPRMMPTRRRTERARREVPSTRRPRVRSA